MKSADELHRLGVLHFERKEFASALEQFRAALKQTESAELWSDWAAAQFACENTDEAEVGFRLALEIMPNCEDALVNLAVVLLRQNRAADALPLLEKALPASSPTQKPAIEKLLIQAREAGPRIPLNEWENYLRGFVRDD